MIKSMQPAVIIGTSCVIIYRNLKYSYMKITDAMRPPSSS